MVATLSLLFLFATFFMGVAATQISLIRLSGVQSLLLAGIIFYTGSFGSFEHLLGAAIFLVFVYVIGLPWILSVEVRKSNRVTASRLSISRGISLLCTLGLLIVGYSVVPPELLSNSLEPTSLLAISISVSLIGLFLLMTRREGISQLLGVICISNAICLMCMLMVRELPRLVETCLYGYIFIGILLLIFISLKSSRS